MVEKQISIEGVMRYDEEQSNETAVPISYRVEAITKPGRISVHVDGFLDMDGLL